MKTLRKAAGAIVARICGYAGLGILAVAALLASDIVLALRVSSGLTVALAAFLMVRSRLALDCDVSKTEIWSMLAPMERRHMEQARRTVAGVLHDAYLRAAQATVAAAAALWALSVITSFAQQPAAG